MMMMVMMTINTWSRDIIHGIPFFPFLMQILNIVGPQGLTRRLREKQMDQENDSESSSKSVVSACKAKKDINDPLDAYANARTTVHVTEELLNILARDPTSRPGTAIDGRRG